MSYSRRQLYAMGEPFGESATRREVGGRIIYGGGGGKPAAPQPTTTITESGPSTTTLNRTTLNEIPQYLTDASRDLVTRGQELSRTPFEAYGGPRVAEFSPDMQTAFDRMRNQQVAPQIGEATGLASLAGQRAMDYGMFGEGVQQYMNPYMQNVVDIERRKAQEAADQQSALLSGQAARQGAFGGSGAALQQRALRRDTAQQLSDIQAQGLDRAYQSAVDQYNQGITGGLAAASQLGGLGQQQFGQEMDITQGLGTSGDVQRQREQALLDVDYGDFLAAKKDPFEKLAFQQGLVSGVPYSTTQRVTGREVTQPGKTVSQVTATPKPAPNQAAQIIGTGAALYGSMGESSGGGGGAPVGGFNNPSFSNMTEAQVAESGGGVGAAKGGEVKRYAVGGIAALNQPEMAAATQGMSDPQVANTAAMPGLPGLTAGTEQMRRNEMRMAAEGQQASSSMNKLTTTLSQMSDAELQQYAKLNKNDPYTMALVVAEADRRKKGGMPRQEQPKVVDQQIASMALPEETGIAQLPVGNMDFAGGGIIAFQGGGATEEATSPFGDAARGMFSRIRDFSLEGEANRQFANMNPADKITQLQSERARIQQGLFESLTPTERQARSAEMQAIDQQIAALASAAAQPAAAPVEPVPEAGLGALVDPSAAPPVAEQQNMGAGPAPAPTRSGAPSLDVEGIMGLRREETDRQLAAEAEADQILQDALARDRMAQQADVEAARTSYSDREERLKKREESMKGDKERNVNMAIFEAGLRLMSGRADDGSTDLLSVLAAGAQQGLKGYQGRLEKINASKEKLDDDFSNMYELRQAKVDAAGKELRDLNQREADLKASGLRNANTIMSALGNEEVNLKTKQFDNMYNEWKTTYEQKSATERARIAAAGGAGGGNKYSDLTAAQKAKLRVDSEKLWNAMSIYEQNKITQGGTTRDQWIEQKARSLIDGPEAASTSANISRADQLVGISP